MAGSRGGVSETYASPALRWAICLEDHPGAFYESRVGHASEFGTPEGWGADTEVCVVTVHFPEETGLLPVDGWKEPENSNRTPEEWNTLVTKTLGRALKKAGYPDDSKDFKTLILWRKRGAELEAIKAGHVTQAIGDGTELQQALDDGARTAPDDDEARPALASGPADDEVTDAEIVGDDDGSAPPDDGPPPAARPARSSGSVTRPADRAKAAPPAPVQPAPGASSAALDPDVAAAHKDALNKASDARVQGDVRSWAAGAGITWARPATDDHARAVIAKVEELIAAQA